MKDINIEYVSFEKLKKYLWKYRWQLLICHLILLGVWFPWLFQTETHVDTEVMINKPYTFYNWLRIGRQGGALTKYLTDTVWFNPYFETFAGYLILCMASVLLGYLFWCVSGVDCAVFSAIGLLCFTGAIMAEQFYFTLQTIMIAWAYVLCSVSVGLSYQGILEKKIWYLGIAMLMMIWTFCSYQVFAVLYVGISVAVFVLVYYRWSLEEKRENMPYWRIIIGLIILFIGAYVINTVITNKFFTSSSYLEGQICWGTSSIAKCVMNILTHIYWGLRGTTILYTPFYGVFAVLVVAIMSGYAIKYKPKLGWLAVMAVMGLQLVPFLLTIYMGDKPSARTQLAYPMVLAFDVMILICLMQKHKIFKTLVIALACICCWNQIQVTERLLYTDKIAVQEDLHVASAIEQRIMAVSEEQKAIAFVGIYENKLNGSCIPCEIIGRSIFDMSSEIAPHYYFSSDRACRVLQTLSYDWYSVSKEEMVKAREYALDMPVWPAARSVVDAGEFIVVKLSEDQWPEEL